MLRASDDFDRKGPVFKALGSTTSIDTVSYQYCSHLFYRKIHLPILICCYCTMIYVKYAILFFFVCNNHRTLHLLQISNQFLF